MTKLWYYWWSTGRWDDGYVIGFNTEEEAKTHAKGKFPDNNARINYAQCGDGEILDIYTGE